MQTSANNIPHISFKRMVHLRDDSRLDLNALSPKPNFAHNDTKMLFLNMAKLEDLAHFVIIQFIVIIKWYAMWLCLPAEFDFRSLFFLSIVKASKSIPCGGQCKTLHLSKMDILSFWIERQFDPWLFFPSGSHMRELFSFFDHHRWLNLN